MSKSQSMKTALLLLSLTILSLPCLSQVNIQIGKCNETVFPVTPNKTNDLAELLPLEKLLAGKKIVGMGEATHGTREFFNMKAKMFKFLATRCGFRVFAIEATFSGTLKVNDYVLYGKGDVLSAMKGMEFWTWDTEEVNDLIEWMKAYNAGKAEYEKLKFYGFDCQSFKGPANVLLDYVKEFDSGNLVRFSTGLSILKDSSYNYFYTLRDARTGKNGIEKIHEITLFLSDWFNQNQEVYISRSGNIKFALAFHTIDELKQVVSSVVCPYKKSWTVRDSCMAQNLKWMVEFENAKVFAWAHNAHICNVPKYFFAKDPTMGAYLDMLFGKDYYKIGFAFNEGSFQAYSSAKRGLMEYSVPVYKKNTLTNALAVPGIDAFFIDLTSSGNQLFTSTQRYYDIGSSFDNCKNSSVPISAKKIFDGLIFVAKTTRAMPLNRKEHK
jgi:erythromycin esterase